MPNGACFAGTIREQLTSGDNTSNIIGYKVNENYGAYILMSVTEVRQYKISGGTIILVGKYLTDSDFPVVGKLMLDGGKRLRLQVERYADGNLYIAAYNNDTNTGLGSVKLT